MLPVCVALLGVAMTTPLLCNHVIVTPDGMMTLSEHVKVAIAAGANICTGFVAE